MAALKQDTEDVVDPAAKGLFSLVGLVITENVELPAALIFSDVTTAVPVEQNCIKSESNENPLEKSCVSDEEQPVHVQLGVQEPPVHD